MNVLTTWATLKRLLEQSFFFYTAALYALESELQTPIHDSVHWSRRFEYPWVIEQLKTTSSTSVLDAGSGATALQFMLVRSGIPTTSVDVDKKAIEWVNTRSTDEFCTKSPKAVYGCLPNIPFPESYFDTCLCISVLEHLPKAIVPTAINELIKKAKKSVIITMDVCLEQHPAQISLEDLPNVFSAVGIKNVPNFPEDTLKFSVDGHNFAVLCMHLQSK